jgi:hypothetical protein
MLVSHSLYGWVIVITALPDKNGGSQGQSHMPYPAEKSDFDCPSKSPFQRWGASHYHITWIVTKSFYLSESFLVSLLS